MTGKTDKKKRRTIYVKPCVLKSGYMKGTLAVVRDPITKRKLREEGETKPDNAFWRRRLKEGAVEKVDKPPKRRASKPADPKPENKDK